MVSSNDFGWNRSPKARGQNNTKANGAGESTSSENGDSYRTPKKSASLGRSLRTLSHEVLHLQLQFLRLHPDAFTLVKIISCCLQLLQIQNIHLRTKIYCLFRNSKYAREIYTTKICNFSHRSQVPRTCSCRYSFSVKLSAR